MLESATNSNSIAGMQFELAEEIQAETRSKMRTAGPIPYSWWKSAAGRDGAAAARAKQHPESRAAISGGHATKVKASSLKEECILAILSDISQDGDLLDEVFYLPFHLKSALLEMAPTAAPLTDNMLDALLLPPEDHDIALPAMQDVWDADTEAVESIQRADTPEKQIAALNLSCSTVSMQMLRRLLLIDPAVHVRETAPRLLRLKRLDLSNSQIAMTSPLLSMLGIIKLSQIHLTGLQCSLYSPLESLAAALPSLKYLDLSHSTWLTWAHVSAVSWDTHWRDLETLVITNCDKLTPQASYQDPESRGGGPPIIMQVQSIIREKGRRKWLDVIA
jgi:hypothetical protein